MADDTTVATGQAASQSLRGRIPALPPAHARALGSFFSAPHSWLLSDNGLLQFMPGQPADPAQTFELDAEGVRVGLRLQATEAVTASGIHWSDYQGRSRILAWSLAHERQLMRLSEALGVALTPQLEPPPTDTNGEVVWLDFLIDDEPPENDPEASRRAPALHGSLRLPVVWLERLLIRAEPPFDGELPTPLGRWNELPASVHLLLQVPPFAPAEWEALHPGDVMLIGPRQQPLAIQARACGRQWPLAPTPQGWRVEGEAQYISPPEENEQMSDHQDLPPDDQVPEGEEAAPAPVDPDAPTRTLPVQVTFEVGRIEMPVGKLAELQPGYVFPVPAQLEGANVTIRANGEAVGQGELVSVGDTLGVRLLSWT